MRLISLLTSDPNDSLDCDYAMIDLNANFARLALRRMAMVKDQQAIDPDLYEIYFWDYHAEYFSPWSAEKADEADALAETLDGFSAVSTDLQIAPANFELPEGVLTRVECSHMVACADAIAFVAIPKHTSSYVHTGRIPLSLIESVAA